MCVTAAAMDWGNCKNASIHKSYIIRKRLQSRGIFLLIVFRTDSNGKTISGYWETSLLIQVLVKNSEKSL